MRNRKKSHRLIFYKEEQGSALGVMMEIKIARALLGRDFLTDILSDIPQNPHSLYMKDAHKIEARYLGVVVWKSRNLGSTIEKSKKCLKNVENVLFFGLF